MKEINYLGHVISENGISPDPEKTRAISELRRPQNVSEVRSVIGMASYYRKFIDHFSEILKPLTELIFIYLFGVLRRFQHCTGHITTGSWKGRGNQYI